MSGSGEGWTRRDFLLGTAGTVVAGAVLPAGAAEAPAAAAGPSATVVLVRDAGVLDASGKPVAAVVEKMIDRAVCELVGTSEVTAAWRSFFKPGDTVGIKTNSWSDLPTPRAVEEALRKGVVRAGVPGERIAIDDRGVLRNPVFRNATALVNTRPMRTHHWAGVGSLLKNYIMFDEQPSRWHDDSCANLAGLWQLPHVAGRTRLNVLVMLTPLFHSTGPHDFNPRHVWPYKGLLVGTDPVAVDATGLRILEAQRRSFFGQDQPMEVPPKHIRVAAEKYKLGVADPARIRLKTIGWTDGLLIV